MLIDGHATLEGTTRYRLRNAERLPAHFRQSRDLWISSIGLGTYLGDPTEEIDNGYAEAAVFAARSGINVFDTAVNYRHMHSERAIGRAVTELISSGAVRRDEIILATKGGFQQWVPGLVTDAQRAIQFVRSTPGITCALVGMSSRKHVEENIATASRPPLSLTEYRRMFQK